MKVINSLFLSVLFVVIIFSGNSFATPAKYQKSIERYTVPDVALYNQDGRKVRLSNYMKSDKPVVLDFIFGTCTTICPVLSAGYANLQKKLGDDSNKIQLVSISIDPENDTPKVMKAYLNRYRARPGWDFLTGSRKDIDSIMHAFNAYIPNKMSHYAITFIYQKKSNSWVRLYGILSSTEFLSEVQKAGLFR